MLFLVSTFIAQIVFLNMLIAVMGDSFDKVKVTEKQSALKETIGLMSNYAIAVSRYSFKEKRESRFMY